MVFLADFRDESYLEFIVFHNQSLPKYLRFNIQEMMASKIETKQPIIFCFDIVCLVRWLRVHFKLKGLKKKSLFRL